LFEAVNNPCLMPFNGEFSLSEASTLARNVPDRKSYKKRLENLVDELDDQRKNWKFSSGDVDESALWGDYMNAYEQALNATSRPWAPWYAIPADDKPSMRLQVAETIVESLKGLNLQYPPVSKKQLEDIVNMRKLLEKPL